MSRRVTAKMGRQILTVRTHSPALLVGAGVVGVVGSVVLACRATLKMVDVLEEGENGLVIVTEENKEADPEEVKKAQFSVRLQLAIKIAKLYAPSAILLTASVGAIAGSHFILKKRNLGLAAAYATVDKTLKDYRGRVVKDQGADKDFEYLHGTEEREIVVEGKNGPETKLVKGLDQEAIRNADPETVYKRVFYGPDKEDENGDPGNKNWSDIPNQNQFFIQMIQSEANDLLRLQDHVFLNQVYDMLGFEPTAAGQMVGWTRAIRKDDQGNEVNDGYISFGVWNDGVTEGKKWLNGDKDALLLDFNVDGVILGALKKV